MNLRLTLVLFSCSLAVAQTPDLPGVWRANLEKSKFGGPAPQQYLLIVEQKGSRISELVGTFGPRGEQRTRLTFSIDGQAGIVPYRGIPTRVQASWNGNTLVLDAKMAGAQPTVISEKYTLAPDGSTLTIDTTTTMGPRTMQQMVVLEKQPDSAGEPLRKPEQSAAARFKNVQVLKDMPASEFLDAMRYFSMSLGVNCEHCHVQNQFASDDKKEKTVARAMVTMTHNANQQAFAGKPEVRCFTCHRGLKEPQSVPSF